MEPSGSRALCVDKRPTNLHSSFRLISLEYVIEFWWITGYSLTAGFSRILSDSLGSSRILSDTRQFPWILSDSHGFSQIPIDSCGWILNFRIQTFLKRIVPADSHRWIIAQFLSSNHRCSKPSSRRSSRGFFRMLRGWDSWSTQDLSSIIRPVVWLTVCHVPKSRIRDSWSVSVCWQAFQRAFIFFSVLFSFFSFLSFLYSFIFCFVSGLLEYVIEFWWITWNDSPPFCLLSALPFSKFSPTPQRWFPSPLLYFPSFSFALCPRVCARVCARVCTSVYECVCVLLSIIGGGYSRCVFQCFLVSFDLLAQSLQLFDGWLAFSCSQFAGQKVFHQIPNVIHTHHPPPLLSLLPRSVSSGSSSKILPAGHLLCSICSFRFFWGRCGILEYQSNQWNIMVIRAKKNIKPGGNSGAFQTFYGNTERRSVYLSAADRSLI